MNLFPVSRPYAYQSVTAPVFPVLTEFGVECRHESRNALSVDPSSGYALAGEDRSVGEADGSGAHPHENLRSSVGLGWLLRDTGCTARTVVPFCLQSALRRGGDCGFGLRCAVV